MTDDDFECPECGSCGYPECCGLKCKYMAEHKQAYEETERESDRYHAMLRYLYEALPWTVTHRWGGDFDEFLDGLGAAVTKENDRTEK